MNIRTLGGWPGRNSRASRPASDWYARHQRTQRPRRATKTTAISIRREPNVRDTPEAEARIRGIGPIQLCPRLGQAGRAGRLAVVVEDTALFATDGPTIVVVPLTGNG